MVVHCISEQQTSKERHHDQRFVLISGTNLHYLSLNGPNDISLTFLFDNQWIVTPNQPSHKHTDKALNYSLNAHFFVNVGHVIHSKQSFNGTHHSTVLTDDVKLHRRDKSTKLPPFAYFQMAGEFK